MYAEDLGPYDYRLPYVLESIFMVGWLDATHPYPRGEVDPSAVDKLRVLIETRLPTMDLHVNTVRGVHPCTLCGSEVGTDDRDGMPMFLGMSELWIPRGSNWYAAPTLVVHFIEAHGYAPPRVFLDAISEFDLQSNTVSQHAYDQAVQKMASSLHSSDQ